MFFADDTALATAHKDLVVAGNILQQNYVRLQMWAHDHGLVINSKKTKCLQILRSGDFNHDIIILHHSHNCLHNNLANCKCNEEIEMVTKYKYLGLIFDYTMNWDEQFLCLRKKLRTQIANFHVIKNYISLDTRRIVYFALAESVISYGLQSYGIGNRNKLLGLQRLQISILRTLIPAKKKNISDDQLFQELKILPFAELYRYKQIIQFFFDESFKTTTKRSHDQVKTRFEGQYFKSPLVYTKWGKKTLRYEIPSLFNLVKAEVLSLKKISEVKTKIKEELLLNTCL